MFSNPVVVQAKKVCLLLSNSVIFHAKNEWLFSWYRSRFYKYRRVLWRVRKRKRTFCHGLTNPSWGTVTCDVYWLNLTNISVWTKRTRDGELRFKHDFSLNKLLPARTVNLQSINFVKANFWIVEAKRTIDWYYGTNTLKVTIGEKQKKLGNFLWVSVWITLQT